MVLASVAGLAEFETISKIRSKRSMSRTQHAKITKPPMLMAARLRIYRFKPPMI